MVNELTRRGRKDGHGNVKWSCVKISRILRNATYMGYIGYNKSKVNNFLEKKRIKNLDESTFILKKGDFEPIVSETLWRQCEEIRKSRIRTLQMPSGEERRQGTRIIQHLWVRKLRCRCGAGYNRFKWRVLQDGTPVYGYQCNYRTQNPAKSFVEKNHLAGQKSCDAISICEWKLDLMAKQIFDKLWGDQQEAVLIACQMVESCLRNAATQTAKEQENVQRTMGKLEQRMLNLAQMRADGELTKDQYQKLYAQAAKELEALPAAKGPAGRNRRTESAGPESHPPRALQNGGHLFPTDLRRIDRRICGSSHTGGKPPLPVEDQHGKPETGCPAGQPAGAGKPAGTHLYHRF